MQAHTHRQVEYIIPPADHRMGGRGIIQRVLIGVMPKFTRANFNRVLYHFNLTNYYLFNVNCTDFDKIQSTVFFAI